jgi:hypothetical protein
MEENAGGWQNIDEEAELRRDQLEDEILFLITIYPGITSETLGGDEYCGNDEGLGQALQKMERAGLVYLDDNPDWYAGVPTRGWYLTPLPGNWEEGVSEHRPDHPMGGDPDDGAEGDSEDGDEGDEEEDR